MKPEGVLKQVLGVFLAALVLYVVLYQWIEHRRTVKGPWQVTFGASTSGAPAIVIQQRTLGLTNIQISFPGGKPGTNSEQTLTFAEPRPVPFPVPFGTCVFEDTTFLPGTVTFHLFGHEIELLPRVLVIDRREHPWHPNSTHTLEPATNTASQQQ